jgi:hypothetical protein
MNNIAAAIVFIVVTWIVYNTDKPEDAGAAEGIFAILLLSMWIASFFKAIC